MFTIGLYTASLIFNLLYCVLDIKGKLAILTFGIEVGCQTRLCRITYGLLDDVLVSSANHRISPGPWSNLGPKTT